MLPVYCHPQLIATGKFSIRDKKKIGTYRGAHNRLGFAYQLAFTRLFNFLPAQHPLQVVDELLTFVALQLDIDKKLIIHYSKYQQHISRHQKQVCDYLLVKAFNKSHTQLLCKYLFQEAQRLDQLSHLLAESKKFLKMQSILQPSNSTLQRLVARQREQARQYIFSRLLSMLTKNMMAKLEQLLTIDNKRLSKLQFLKDPPAAPSVKSLLTLVRKLEIIEETQILELDLTWVNNNYQRNLTKYVMRSSAHRLKELSSEHRYTALVCFLWQISKDTVDHMVEMHFKIMTTVYSTAENKITASMQEKRKSIKKSLNMLDVIGNILLNTHITDEKVRDTVFEQIERNELQLQIKESDIWLSGKYSHVFKLVVSRFNYLRRFSPGLMKHLEFNAEGNKSKSLVTAVGILKAVNQQTKRRWPTELPLDFIPKKLKNIVAPKGVVDKRAWECAVLVALRDDVKAGNISVKKSKRYGKFDQFFISTNQWEQKRSEFFKRAQLPEKANELPGYLITRLNKAYDNFFHHYAHNEYAKVIDGKWALSVDPAETLTMDENRALEKLRAWITAKMRAIKLPELLIEVDNDLHFTDEFLLAKLTREPKAVRNILVTLLAHGCFIGPYTMAKLTNGVSYKEICHVTDWQLTEEAQRSALAKIVNAIAKLDVTQYWGSGRTSSSDGQRYEYKRKSLRQTFSTKFGDYALEFYTFVADNYAPYYSTPIECTERDAPYALDGILYNENDLPLYEHFTDTHGYMEINFTAFTLLGRKHSPRIRNVKKQRIYKIDKAKNYGVLAPLLAANDRSIHMDWIVDQWDRMGHFYASLETGHVTASTALKRLAGFSDQNHFYRANREFGRIIKTENILEYMTDPVLRQNRRRGLLKGEQIHQLARDVAYGKRGKISARELHEQKNTCSCLTLLLACIIYWQAKEIGQIIKHYGEELPRECLAMLPHISPIGWDNVVLYGEYVVDLKLIK